MTHMFIDDTDGAEVLFECSDSKTWMELTEIYVRYLQACGYVLTREMFAEEINKMYGKKYSAPDTNNPWQRLEDTPIPEKNYTSVLIYSPSQANDEEFPGHPYHLSNPVWANLHALKNGYTHWMKIPKIEEN